METPELESAATMQVSSAIWDTLGHRRHPHEPDLQDRGPFGGLHSDRVAARGWWSIPQSILDDGKYLWLSNWIVPPDVIEWRLHPQKHSRSS